MSDRDIVELIQWGVIIVTFLMAAMALGWGKSN